MIGLDNILLFDSMNNLIIQSSLDSKDNNQKHEICMKLMEGYEHSKASIEEMIEYSGCVNYMYQDGVMFLWALLMAVVLIGFIALVTYKI